MPGAQNTKFRTFTISVLGRTLEHLGNQLYKRREPAIAELIANCWDAHSSNVWIQVPLEEEYSTETSEISIEDDGCGMSEDNVQDNYLVVGRNRRAEADTEESDSADVTKEKTTRAVMGRKGIGKLAGFGMAKQMIIRTWKDGESTEFTMDCVLLKNKQNKADEVPLQGRIDPYNETSKPSGTIIRLRQLKHKTPIDIKKLKESLARRFSRKTRGEMKIYINGAPLGEPTLDLEFAFPEKSYDSDCPAGEQFHEEEIIPGGPKVLYRYAFHKGVIPQSEMRGFTIYARGKTAQAPPFFFNIEGKASGQHGTKYLTGDIEADFIDSSDDDESDIISTDRQEIDWDSEGVIDFKKWGEELSRRLLREWAARKGEKFEETVLQNPALGERITSLDPASQRDLKKHLKTISQSNPDSEDSLRLADSLVTVYEFEQFHNLTTELDAIGDDPEKMTEFLDYLSRWGALESRAILTIIKGRLDLIQKFETMLVNNAPETAPNVGTDNLHDLIGRFPWILNPDWEIFSEEKKVSTQLREWHYEDIREEDKRLRYDFLAIANDAEMVVIEIKRPEHALTIDDAQRAEKYRDRLSSAHSDIRICIVCGKIALNKQDAENWKNRKDGEILHWATVVQRTKKRYEHYRAVLEKDIKHPDFAGKKAEVAKTRTILHPGSAYRDKTERAKGVGPSKP
ncbi:Histidine kinase-, DNA gyrase B-, and HSP90-like ATPase [uncultured archaeon]|nr:Histidine kinase-, DNA gyrase B-, and HSP90-like ATPase [uncultured archaeon]